MHLTLYDTSIYIILFPYFSVQERFPDKEETYDALAKKPLLRVQEKLAKGKSKGIKKSKCRCNMN